MDAGAASLVSAAWLGARPGSSCGRARVGLGLVEEGGKLRQFGAELVGDAPPLRPRR